MSDNDVVEMLVKEMAEMFHKTYFDVRSHLVNSVVKRWGIDPYAIGGYAFSLKGEVTVCLLIIT